MLENNTLGREENINGFRNSVDKEIREKRRVKGLTRGQAEYLNCINNSVITLCTGCAGTGKTFIAITRAIELFNDGMFKRIVVSRPIVECGEKLGFLPGDLDEKTDPYMRPINDIMMDLIDHKLLTEYKDKNIIEYCPLEYMRGRTLNQTIMILDEAQNATWEQLMMFLTRIGYDSKIIVSGDETQKDNFVDAYEQCADKFNSPPYIDGINVIELTEADIVRNSIIRKIIQKMGQYDPHYRKHR